MPSPLQLDRRFRWTVYAVFGVLFLTGLAWIVADQLKDSAESEFWQKAAANLLMIHGGSAMITLLLLGALFPVHVTRAWRTGINRVTGSVMVSINVVLVLTAFGLYYLGPDNFRLWVSDTHIVVGLALPVVVFLHIWLGRRRTGSSQNR